MKVLISLVGAVGLLAGLGCMFYAFGIPRQYDMATASAIQSTQVYSMATFWAALGIGFLMFALVCVASTQLMNEDALALAERRHQELLKAVSNAKN